MKVAVISDIHGNMIALEAVLEDIARCMEELMRAQREGELPFGLFFVWDSVGSIGCYKEFKSASANNMWAAGALSVSFNKIINNLIPSSRVEIVKFCIT